MTYVDPSYLATSADPSQTDPNDPYAGLVNALTGPADLQAQQQAQLSALNAQTGIAENQISSQQAGQSYQDQLANLILRQQGYQIDQGALLRQFNPQTGQGLIPQYANMAQQSLAQQLQQAQFGAGQQQRSDWSGAAGRGATNTSGFGQQISDIATNLGFTTEGINRQQAQTNLQYGEQENSLQDALARLNLQMANGPLPASPYPGMGALDISNIALGQNLTNAQQGYNISNAGLAQSGYLPAAQLPNTYSANANAAFGQLGVAPPAAPATTPTTPATPAPPATHPGQNVLKPN